MPAPDAPAVKPGILLVDKPEGITSHGVVARLRRAADTRKVGHAGTLDPMATGMLIAGVGTATRLLTHLVGLDKEYTATIRLGQATTTDDREGEPLSDPVDARPVNDEEIRSSIEALTGEIMQVPSSVSAIKVDGKRSYVRVREGDEVVLAARPVTVAEFELRDRRDAGQGFVDLDVRVVCSSGTYIRALARDLGESVGTGGHLTALRRTRVGPFVIEDAEPLETFDERGSAAGRLLRPSAVASKLFPVAHVDVEAALDIRNGKRVPVDTPDSKTPVAVIDPHDALIALVSVSGGICRVITGFPEEPR